MDFDFSKEQSILKESASRFLEKECPKQLVRELIEDEKGYSSDLWRKIADLGWLGVMFPMAYGGTDGTLVDLVLLQEEMGRALMPGPFVPTVVVGGGIIMAAGSEDQKQHFIPKIATGEMILSMALLETGGNLNPSDIRVKATQSGEDFTIEGKKRFVPYGHVADYLLCLARTRASQNGEEGITLFLVDSRADGIHIEPLKTITGEKLCEVRFQNVRVRGSDMVGKLDQGWPLVERMLTEAAIAECGWMIGGARWVLETAIAYARERIQFGVPIGSFQAIQHKCSDMITDIDGATLITYYAAWLASEDDPNVSLAASEAKSWCNDMYHRVASEGIQILGGIGFTLEHDMQLYFRRAMASGIAFGDSHHHREKLARMFDL